MVWGLGIRNKGLTILPGKSSSNGSSLLLKIKVVCPSVPDMMVEQPYGSPGLDIFLIMA